MDHVVPDDMVRSAVALLVVVVEVGAVVIIFCGAVIAFLRFVRAALRGGAGSFVPIRLDLGRYLTLGLELQLGADLLRTAVAPTFREIGQLAAVAAIRTGLNFFLARETRREREEMANAQRAKLDVPSPT